MFERRLKIFLGILGALTLLLVGRALQVEVIRHEYWQSRSAQTLQRSQLVETVRGSILDCRGREVAVDQACIDACVDYRAITSEPEEKWLRDRAETQLKARLGLGYTRGSRQEKRRLLDQECKAVKADIDRMWDTLSRVSGKSEEEIEDIRRAIVQRVEMRRRYLWYRRYQQARQEREQSAPSPWYKAWLAGLTDQTPQLDSFAIEVAEQTEAHAVLRDITPQVANFLGKNIEQYPGLVLRPGIHRFYPYNDAASHVLGHLSRVNRDDLENDPNAETDELRKYYANDLIGRTGLEALCEPALRGSRGRIERGGGDQAVLASQDAVPGRNVRMTLDIELQAEIQQMFAHAQTANPDNTLSQEHEMHGAAVVIALPSGEVRALASYPAFNLNDVDEHYSQLAADMINQPLLNRATQYPLEPGSTVKPMVGIGAITQGVLKLHEGIECTGFLVLHGKRYSVGRCWVASQFLSRLGPSGVAHHQVPWEAPHRGSYGNPDGFLIFPEALERSCNVFFETVADRLGLEGVSAWFERFGLGHPTGLGIAEWPGRLPGSYDAGAAGKKMATWMSGIGQGPVAATPIQMANVAATIARNGIWVRPHLVSDDTPVVESKLCDRDGRHIPDRVDLKLSPEALAAAREGMVRVVNSPGGTGTYVKLDGVDVVIAAKTGTAQAAPFSVPRRDGNGQLVHDEKGRVVRDRLIPSTSQQEYPQTSWYRATGEKEDKLDHGWIIGFAPADHPQIAFAVMVEYGGSGGRSAAPIARRILEACIEHGYLSVRSRTAQVQP